MLIDRPFSFKIECWIFEIEIWNFKSNTSRDQFPAWSRLVVETKFFSSPLSAWSFTSRPISWCTAVIFTAFLKSESFCWKILPKRSESVNWTSKKSPAVKFSISLKSEKIESTESGFTVNAFVRRITSSPWSLLGLWLIVKRYEPACRYKTSLTVGEIVNYIWGRCSHNTKDCEIRHDPLERWMSHADDDYS